MNHPPWAPHLLTSYFVRKQFGRVFAKGTKDLTRSSIFLADRVFLVSSKQAPSPSTGAVQA